MVACDEFALDKFAALYNFHESQKPCAAAVDSSRGSLAHPFGDGHRAPRRTIQLGA